MNIDTTEMKRLQRLIGHFQMDLQRLIQRKNTFQVDEFNRD